MEFRVLGPVEVVDDGRRLDLGGRKQRTVLALLVANAGHTVSTDRLIEGIYGDDAPDGARRSVQTYVSNLRSQIGDQITSVASGYEFQPIDSLLDAVEFTKRVDAARSSIDDDPASAGAELRTALALWRGHAFADVDARSELDAEITRLSELRLVALESRIDADLAAGQDRELVGELEALTADHPFREGFRSQLMLSLYRSGRQAEALRAYTRMREYLADELGVDPSAELRQLEQRMLEQDPALLLVPRTAVRRRAVLVVDLTVNSVDLPESPDERREVVAEVGSVIEGSIVDADGAIAAQRGTATYGTFGDVRPALDAAVAIATTAPYSSGSPIVRAGLDIGDIEEEPGGGVSGPAVVRAAGLVAAAHPGQVLLSTEAQSAAAADEAGGAVLRALGRHQIARLEEPEVIHQLVIEGLPAQYPDLIVGTEAPELPAGHVDAPGYELREELGRGLFGVVFRGYQSSVGREVAVKVINPDLANSTGFIRRFAVEAQMIARIEHPNVVPLYDFWRGPGQALLVMRLMRGGNLAEWVSTSDVDREVVLRLVDQVGGALATAHSLGIAHGDVQASNVLLNESGDFFLSDFGIAGDTPTLGGGLAQQLDVAAFASMVLAAVPVDAMGEGEVAVLEAGRRGDVSTAAELLGAWRREVGAAAASPTFTPTRNPYKGLAAFSELDAQDFHGRDDLVEELVGAAEAQRLVAIVGPSGIGKSSVVRAGLLPALRAGGVAGSGDWLIADCLPGAHPFERLAAALLRVASSDPGDLEEELRSGGSGLVEAVKRFLPAGSELLLVIDQFEELFTLTREPEIRDQFLDLLAATVDDDSGSVRVVVTLRADFFDRPLRHPQFGALLRAGTVPIAAPTEAELHEIVVRPAAGVGVAFEPGLAERIVGEVHGEAGALPLVEFALTELFDSRESDELTLGSYEASGGVTAALGRRAEAIYAGLDGVGRDVARQVFMRLVTPGEAGSDTRRRVRLAELNRLGLEPAAIDMVLGAFGERRLLTFDLDEVTRGGTVEVAHEALLREWPRLTGWVDGHREELVLRGRLGTAVADWNNANRADAYLLSGGRLTQHEAWVETTNLPLSSEELELLALSRSAEDVKAATRSRRRRFIMSGFAAAAGIALVLAAVAYNSSRQANADRLAAQQAEIIAEEQATLAQEERDRAAANAERADQNAALAEERAGQAQAAESLAEARELAASAINVLEEDPELATLLTLEAIAVTPEGQDQPPEVIDSLWQAVQANRLTDAIEPGYGGPITIDMSADGTRLAVASPQGASVQMYDAPSGDMIWEFTQDTMDSIEFPSIRPDGGLVVVGAIDSESPWAARGLVGIDELPARLLILDGATGDLVNTIEYPGCPGVPVSSWSPDGAYLAVAPDPGGCLIDGSPHGQWVEVYDTQTWLSVAVHGLEDAFAVAPQFDRSGKLYVFDQELPPWVFDEEFEPIGRIEGASGFGDVSPDGDLVVVTRGGDPYLGLVDTSTGAQVDTLRPIELSPAIPVGLRFSDDGAWVIATFEGDDSRIWNVASGDLAFVLAGGPATSGVFDTSRQRFYSANTGVIKVWDLGPSSAGITVAGDLAEAKWVNGNSFVIGSEFGALHAIDIETFTWYVRFFDLETGRLIEDRVEGYGPVAALPDGRFAFPRPDGTQAIYDPDVGIAQRFIGCATEDFEVCLDSGEPFADYALTVSREGSELLALDHKNGELTLLDPTTGSPQGEITIPGGIDNLVGFSADWIFGQRGDGETFFVERSTGNLLWNIFGSRHIQLDPSGTVAAVANADGTLRIVDTATWNDRALGIEVGLVRGLGFDQTADHLAVGDESNLHIVDLRTDTLVQTIPIPFVSDIYWINDTTIVIGTREGLWATLSLDPADLIDAAGASTTRTFTSQECLTYRIDPCPVNAEAG